MPLTESAIPIRILFFIFGIFSGSLYLPHFANVSAHFISHLISSLLIGWLSSILASSSPSTFTIPHLSTFTTFLSSLSASSLSRLELSATLHFRSLFSMSACVASSPSNLSLVSVPSFLPGESSIFTFISFASSSFVADCVLIVSAFFTGNTDIFPSILIEGLALQFFPSRTFRAFADCSLARLFFRPVFAMPFSTPGDDERSPFACTFVLLSSVTSSR
mmetsp:Transcript_25209/g.35151  ORF Transcript_25209/g.35151 Transcript_25209/m.35151 type:complete len:219 (-) Transcript_25209:309-965(-)